MCATCWTCQCGTCPTCNLSSSSFTPPPPPSLTPAQVLRQEFPGVRIADDVCSLESLPPETEVLTAGFPCIDVSRAGLRRGLDGLVSRRSSMAGKGITGWMCFCSGRDYLIQCMHWSGLHVVFLRRDMACFHT
jgi:hypothetical protein